MVWRQTFIFCTFLISVLKIQQVVCSGVFELRLKSFLNENGKDSLGRCCSSGERNGRCIGPCRTRFRVCLKHYQQKIDMSSPCTFGDVMTPVLGENNVHLGGGGGGGGVGSNSVTPDSAGATAGAMEIAGFTNPIRFPFDFTWPGTFSLIVEAWHDSASSNVSGMAAAVDSSTGTSNNGTAAAGGAGGGKPILISRITVQRWLDVTTQWTEEEHKLSNTKMLYEFRVTCDPHYYGGGCGKLCRPRDDNFGHYTCSPSGEIVCMPGWKGDYCTKPKCLQGCDETHGYCAKPGECLCHSGWKGKLCSDCETYPGCLHGTCQKPWQCSCDEGWGGLLCNQDLNYCTNHKPCRNGGTCFNTGEGSYTCSCPPGYTGTDCDIKLKDCSHMPCLNGATCKENGTSYQCECPKGWYGTHCENALQTCEAKPCQRGGTCLDSIHGYKCLCPAGYTGPECQNAIEYCAPNPCANGGNCTALPVSSGGGFKCACASGFAGAKCQTNIDDCHGNPCANGGSCVDLVNGYRCQCVAGYVGKHCQQEVDYCLVKPCANGGTCENLVNDYQCKCRPGFTGKDCSVDLDECGQSPCRNGGTCYRGGRNGFQCECAPGYGGRYCETENADAALVGNVSRHVSVMAASSEDGDESRVASSHWYVIAVLSVAVPILVLIAVLIVNRMKQRRKREQRKADEEARLQNEQNSVHSSVTKRGDTHMIKNTWGQCVKNVEADNAVASDLCYPKPLYAAVPVDHNLAPTYTLQRSRSQKQLNVDPPLHRHSVCNRVSCKDLDSIVRTSTPASLDNRRSVLSINISNSNLSDSALTKQQQCSQLLEKDKGVFNNTLNSSVLNSSIGSTTGSSNGNGVYVVDEHFTQTLFATEV